MPVTRSMWTTRRASSRFSHWPFDSPGLCCTWSAMASEYGFALTRSRLEADLGYKISFRTQALVTDCGSRVAPWRLYVVTSRRAGRADPRHGAGGPGRPELMAVRSSGGLNRHSSTSRPARRCAEDRAAGPSSSTSARCTRSCPRPRLPALPAGRATHPAVSPARCANLQRGPRGALAASAGRRPDRRVGTPPQLVRHGPPGQPRHRNRFPQRVPPRLFIPGR